ncbi:MAG TPA: carboxypeptidase regulatory-like domain-containing protein, partial [Vicinamibacterales bacterium]
MRLKGVIFAVLAVLALAGPASAQQTGSISGKVADTSGAVLPGVTVEASSNLLPTPRSTVTTANGEYRLPALPPGAYTVTFTLSGMQTVTRQANVQLQQEVTLDVALGVAAVSESVTVTAAATLVERESAQIKSGVSNEQIMALPVGQEYRDLVKLIPGVQYTQDQTRGPSAGGSGQDNVYQFDGANVTLPLFGTLSAEPASHDIEQVTTIKGGARAIDFDRSGGFTIDSVSKSGTNRYAGEVSYQFQNNAMAADLKTGTLSRYEQDRTWLTANVGGPILPKKLFFYGSYYRPERSRDNRANLYGDLPKYNSTRNEGFGKLTFTPTGSVLVNVSYRGSHRLDKSDLFASNATATTGTGNESWQKIATAEGSWVINSMSHVTFKYTHFGLETLGRPDFESPTKINPTIGAKLDIVNLEQQGQVSLPTPISTNAAFSTWLQPYIDKYGYTLNGVKTGGSTFGYATQYNDQDFYRDNGQAAYNMFLGSTVTHDIHVGYQWYKDSEHLLRSSNGWGTISMPGGRTSFNGSPIYFTARYQQQATGQAAPIVSEYVSQSIELNDMIRFKNWTFNAGLLMSNDTLYGQGLREDKSTLSGYVAAPGNKYNMKEMSFADMLQPRVSTTWAYSPDNTVFASFARYMPSASSLPRAASWDRNLTGKFVDAHFDVNGTLFGLAEVGSSSGKLFVPDIKPRTIDEYLVGTSRQLNAQWSARLYGRYRHGQHFWEDTNNDARIAYRTPLTPSSVPNALYIENLSAQLAQIGSGSTYVIAELDGAYTKYYEATLESEWRGRKAFVRGSYTWSHYYGNLDQDNTTVGNDDNIFIGSSNIADSGGRQLWDLKDGDLRGDRRHMLKLYGYHAMPWSATLGAYIIAQSGQPWEAWSYEPYAAVVGTSTSDTIRYAERADSRRTPSHWQMDLNYTHNIRLQQHLNIQIAADLFNVFNRQTGYNPQPSVHS